MNINFLRRIFQNQPYRNKKLRRFFILTGIGLSLLWMFQCLWTIKGVKGSAFQHALASAVTNFHKDLEYRLWAASHGGVYVPIDKNTLPNPYLKVPYRDVITVDGLKLTLFNPAYMTRKVHEISHNRGGDSHIHLTSILPLNPINTPDAWERKALAELASGKKEFYELVMFEGQKHLRYIGSLPVEKGCLKCHAEQGYKLGDMKGGLSISIPYAPFEKVVWKNSVTNFVGHLIIWIIMMTVLIKMYFSEKISCLSQDMSDALAMDLNMQLANRLDELHSENIKLLQAEAKNEKLIKELHAENEKVLEAQKNQERLENELRQAQKMEAIGTLAGGIAHDFNNLLSIIIGFTELSKFSAIDSHRPTDNEENVLVAAKKASELVRQILSFSRQHEGKKMPMLLSPGLKEILKMIRSSFPSTIEIIQNIDHQHDRIFADPTQVHQIVTNLCTNALHAMESKGGKLSINLKKVWLNNDQLRKYPNSRPGEYMQLSVSDTGDGIKPEIRERIFEPYFTTKGIARGTGLGLAIVHGIATSYGGFVTVESVEGEGSTFHVFFPVCTEEETKESYIMPTSAKICGQEKILFVDDESQIVDCITQGLSSAGYKVTSTIDSREALKKFVESPDDFDLVITDQTMPKVTGIELAQEILKIRPKMPVVICSGYSSIINDDMVRGMGIKRFVTKPIELEAMLKLIREVLDKKL